MKFAQQFCFPEETSNCQYSTVMLKPCKSCWYFVDCLLCFYTFSCCIIYKLCATWHYSDVTWGSRCLNSLTSQLCVQRLVQGKNYKNTKLHITEFYEGNLPSCSFPQWYASNSLGNCFVLNRQPALKQYGPSHLKHMVSLGQNELNTVVS